jgi:hypothetical protein
MGTAPAMSATRRTLASLRRACRPSRSAMRCAVAQRPTASNWPRILHGESGRCLGN